MIRFAVMFLLLLLVGGIEAQAATTLNYYYTNGTSYYQDAAHTQSCTAPSAIYADFADAGKNNLRGIKLNWAILSNGIYDIGFILDSPDPTEWGPLWGGAVIGYLSYRRGANLISAYDAGRELQPSYWATEAAGDPDYITLGFPNYDEETGAIIDYYGAAHYWNSAPGTGRVLSASFDGAKFTTTTKPGLWFGHLTDDVLTQAVGFDATGEVVNIQYDYQYNGPNVRKGFWVNAPCIYSPRTVANKIAGYAGGAPWTGAALTTIDMPIGYAVRGLGFTEPWGALVNASGYGVGLMSQAGAGLYDIPASIEAAAQGQDVVFDPEMGAASNMTGANQVAVNPDPTSTSLNVSQMVPGTTYSLRSYVTVGNVSDIQSRFYAVAGYASVFSRKRTVNVKLGG